MLIPSRGLNGEPAAPSLSRRVNANSQQVERRRETGLQAYQEG